MRVIQKALTFDDVLLLPAHSRILPRDASLKSRLTRELELNIPLVSAAMDTVTEARLAIAIAQEGGIGIIHKNLTPEAQAAEVAKVKRFESGVLRDPMTIPPDMTVREALQAAGIKDAAALGIFGRRVAADTRLAHGDRVEIYRPLLLDPKERRRERAGRRRR